MGTGVEIAVEAPRGALSLAAYANLLNEVRLTLDDVDRLVLPGRHSRIDWVVDDLSVNGAYRAKIVPRGVPYRRQADTIPPVPRNFVSGVAHLQGAAEIPPLFSPRAVERVAVIGKPVGEHGVRAVHLRDLGDHDEATVDPDTIEHAKEATHKVRDAYGSVEGALDVLGIGARGVRAQVIDPRTRRAITIVAALDDREQLRNAWGDMVRVWGVLKRNSAGQPVRIEMTELRVIPEREAVSAWSILGIDPGFTGDMSTEEFVRQGRRG